MRILWFSHFVPWPLRLGAAIRSYHLIEQLARVHEVSFLGFCQRSLDTPEAIEEAREALARQCSRVQLLPIPSERGPFHRYRIMARSLVGPTYDEVWLSSAEMSRALSRELASFAPAAMHLDTLGLVQYAHLAPENFLILNHHNVESQMMRRRAEKSRLPAAALLLRSQANRLERLEGKSADCCAIHLTVSELDADRLRAVAPSARICIVPNGVDLDFFDGRRRSEDVVPESMVFVGGMDWYPNHEAIRWFLANVYPMLRKEFPSATLTVVGRGSEAMGRSADGITGTGEVADIRPILARSAAFICPIHDGGGTRLKVLDALAQRIPLVATSVAVEGLALRSGEQVLLANTVPGFVEALRRLFKDPASGESMADRGRSFVEREYSWERVGQQLLRAYQLVDAGSEVVSK